MSARGPLQNKSAREERRKLQLLLNTAAQPVCLILSPLPGGREIIHFKIVANYDNVRLESHGRYTGVTHAILKLISLPSNFRQLSRLLLKV